MQRPIAIGIVVLALASYVSAQEGSSEMRDRPRLRDLGLKIGVYQLGPLNAITDVGGVRVGQVTIIRGDDVRTGVTVIVPHAGNMFQDKVAAAVYVYNAFGKLIGSTVVSAKMSSRRFLKPRPKPPRKQSMIPFCRRQRYTVAMAT
jgi:D-aminopeptidase